MKTKLGQLRSVTPEADYREPIVLQSQSVKIFRPSLLPKPQKPHTRFQYSNLQPMDLLTNLQNSKIRIIETVFFSQQKIRVFTKNGIQIESISNSLPQLVKSILTTNFKITNFTNESLIQLVSTPTQASQELCFANYGLHNDEVAILTTKDLCKPFLQT